MDSLRSSWSELSQQENAELARVNEDLTELLRRLSSQVEELFYSHPNTDRKVLGDGGNEIVLENRRSRIFELNSSFSKLDLFLGEAITTLPRALTIYATLDNHFDEAQSRPEFMAAAAVVMRTMNLPTFDRSFPFAWPRQTLINSMLFHTQLKLSTATIPSLLVEFINTAAVKNIDDQKAEGPYRHAVEGYNELVWLKICKEADNGQRLAISNALIDYLLTFRTLGVNEQPDLGGAVELVFRIACNDPEVPLIETLFSTLIEGLIYHLPLPQVGPNLNKLFLEKLTENYQDYLIPEGLKTYDATHCY